MVNVTELAITVSVLETQVNEVSVGADEMWQLVTGTFVFLMQVGFAMLECGTVQKKNAMNILYKGMVDPCISGIFFWLIGYAFAYGDTKGGFIGTTRFALSNTLYDVGDGIDQLNYDQFWFQWVFAAACVTIVSGSVAERCKLEAYFVYAIAATTYIYPVVVHWCWGQGWLSPFADETDDYLLFGLNNGSNGFIDFAGSGVVHMTGGLLGLCGAIALGPRLRRFGPDGEVNYEDFRPHNVPLLTLGGLLLWVGWYGFNPGSTLAIVGSSAKLAAKVATMTTISAAGSGCTMVIIHRIRKNYDAAEMVNAILAGLVGITAACAVVDPWGALLIGIISTFVLILASKALLMLRIDDPLDAFPVHGACGMWGVLAVGIFGNDVNAEFAGYLGSGSGSHPFRSGEQFAVQLVGLLAILAWTVANGLIIFYGMQFTMGIRVAPVSEDSGLDKSLHGGDAYDMLPRRLEEGSSIEPAKKDEPVDITIN